MAAATALVALAAGSPPIGAAQPGGAGPPVAKEVAASSPYLAASVPPTPVGSQLRWVLTAVGNPPLSPAEINAHFDARFLSAIDDAKLNSVFGQLGAMGGSSFIGVLAANSIDGSMQAVVRFGTSTLEVSIAVDSAGLIEGLRLTPYSSDSSWAAVDRSLAGLGPDVSLVAARVSPTGTCIPIHQLAASTPRPTASMFKLFVLGALAHQIASGRVSWNQELTVEPTLTSMGSSAGSLQYSPPGTRVTVREAAIKMISISDNTAADMLIHLVGRTAVEAQVENWAAHPGRDEPFLTTRELFLLHYVDFPSLANAYLGRTPSQRRAFLASSVDPLSLHGVHVSTVPRDVGSLEWFASPDDLCRAFGGLQALHRHPSLAPLATVLSTNTGDLGLDPTRWPTVWFKGGSEPGVLTLGYRAVADNGRSYVVVAMVENPGSALAPSATVQLVDVVKSAFGLLG